MRLRTLLFATVGASIALALGPSLASGQEIFDDSISACTAENCSSLRIPATVFSFGVGGSAGNFTINAYGSAGQCLRFDLNFPASPDMEIVVVAPNGSVYRNDDRTPFDLRPLVKIGSAPNSGWYTVHVSHWLGAAVETNVVLLYGRYNGGNPNCAGSTLPLSGFESELEDAAKPEDDGPAPAPKAGHPGSTR